LCAQASASVQSVIISLRVRSLPIVEAKAGNRGAVRHCRLPRRLESSVQHGSHAASPGDPAASEGTDPSNFDYAWGLVPYWAKDPSNTTSMINAKFGDSRHEASFPRSSEIPQVFDPSRWLLRMAKKGTFQAAVLF